MKMNKDNAKDYLPLVQAMADGKDIEYKDFADVWSIKSEINFSDEPDKYRIKPEPRECYVAFGNSFATPIAVSSGHRDGYVKVREVIE
jgi:hypothetical protein